MKKTAIVAVSGFLAVVFLCSLNYAQEVGQAKRPNEDDAKPVEWGKYEYIITSTLDEKQEEYMGKYVRFVDELAVLWDEPTPHDSAEEKKEAERKGFKGDHDNQTLAKKYFYIKFDTNYFRCLLPKEFQSSYDYIKKLNSQRNFDDVSQRKARRKLMYIYGKLVRTTVWGEVNKENDPGNETETEEVVMMVHLIKTPPDRFFKEAPNEEDQ